MADVVLDMDVASLIFEGKLPTELKLKLACITFATLGELVQWTEYHAWALSLTR
ncbi:MAG: hypothetical protein M3443_03255 [Actinomycetota bacterium]|nr:hypothetical protein [Actinomycetota bacterium]